MEGIHRKWWWPNLSDYTEMFLEKVSETTKGKMRNYRLTHFQDFNPEPPE
jgi:hypothetical protein